MTVAVAHHASGASAYVMEAAVDEAARRDTTLVVINVVTTKDLDTEEALRSGIGGLVEQAAAARGVDGVGWEVVIATSEDATIDDTATAILDAAEAAGAQMLVIGARRRSRVGKAFLGSVTQELLLDSSVPVLVVKDPVSA
ncbi:universal stress protein [Phycicoccus sonneratiae]|uniref:Universal stress protein n=1 Tax=Phycicoccus sonneratiae TaxID=2807628 RepID=A0ABS2CNB8_9MICO|nr:universal stress protein [Phycicoccus sonneraticus]MBM6401318.1 universal stress protein [Phycicoccus sonneraticus]